ncbi:MAG: DUF4326 domain-containing protein [Bauldia sp.]|nr:DUF4326 domain-containing protein [Bauldia sp.]
MPANSVYVGRPTRWGNPLREGMWRGYTAANAVRDYRRWIERDLAFGSFDNAFGVPPTIETIRTFLRGRTLVCWCAANAPCHADVLLDLANAGERP